LTISEPRGYFFLFLKIYILLQGVTTLAKGRATTTQIRKADPLMEQYLHTSSWVKERSRPIAQWVAIGAGAVVVAAIVWWFFSNRATNAAESMARAMAAHQAIVQNPLPTLAPGQIAFKTEDEKHREAYRAFTQAANEYPSYNGDTARYFAAVHQLHFEADKAEATLKELAQKDSEVGAQARMALAQRYEAAGRNDEAMAEYQKLKAKPGPIPVALIDLSAGRVYEAMGKTKEAADLYFTIASNKDLRSSEVGGAAVDRLSAIAPERVDQLPPPDPAGMRFPGAGSLPFN
jgi:tetratricopeptide (TPR) repeat protein